MAIFINSVMNIINMKRSSLTFELFVLLFVLLSLSSCNLVQPGSDLAYYGIQVDDPVFNPPEGKYNVPSIAVEISSQTQGATIFYALDEEIPHGIDTWVFALQSLNGNEVDNCASLFYNPNGEQKVSDILSLSDCYRIFFDLNKTLPGGVYQWLYELDGISEGTVNNCLDLLNVQPSSFNYVNPYMGDCYKVFDVLNESVTNSLESWLYTGPFTITKDTKVSAVAYKDGMDPSNLVSINYDITWIPPPDNIAPTISIIEPKNTTFFEGDNIKIVTEPNDIDGNVSRVEFSKHIVGVDWELLGSVKSEPFEFTIKNVSEGTFVVKAVAYDNLEASNSTKIEINVLSSLLAPKENNTPPNVTLLEPENGKSFKPGDVVWLKADAQDADGIIKKVEFYEGGTLIGSDDSKPFNFAWDAVTEDSYVFSAKAIDSDGASAISQQVSIKVAREFANTPPTVYLKRPKDKDHFVIDNIVLEAEASDPDGYIDRVEFYRDGTVLLNSDLTKPFSYQWDNIGAGTYNLKARAYDFEKGMGESKTITISVSPISSADNDLPNVSIYSPHAEDKFIAGQIVPIIVNASDDKSIKLVEYLFNGDVLGKISSNPFTYYWNATVGEFVLTARAYDDRGDTSLSKSVKIIVRPTIYCGDGVCNADETCNSCSLDCGKCNNSKDSSDSNYISNLFSGKNSDSNESLNSGIITKSNQEEQNGSDVEFIVSETAKENIKERSVLRDFNPSWIWGPVLIILFVVVLIFIVKTALTTGFRKNPGIPKENLIQAKEYIRKMVVFGFDEEHMRQKMKEIGWSDEQLDYVFAINKIKKSEKNIANKNLK